jgi:hypothetical protein
MLETRIVMRLLIFCLILLLVLHLISFMDLTIAHMVLVHERITLSLDTLVIAHVLIVVIIPCVGMVFLLEVPILTLSRDALMFQHFPHHGSHPTRSNGEVRGIVNISSSHMVTCRISKIFLTNPSTEPSTFSHSM